MTASTSPTSSGSRARGRLVEEHHVRVHRQRPGDRDALLLAAGEVRRVGVLLVGQADLGEVPAGDLDRLVLAAPLRPAAGRCVRLRSTLRCGKRLNCWKTIPIRARTSSRSISGSQMSMPSTRIVPGRRLLEPVDAPQQRRLARPGRTDDADHLSVVDWKSMPLSTSLSPKYLCRSATSMAVVPLAPLCVLIGASPLLSSLEPGDELGERERDDQVARRDRHERAAFAVRGRGRSARTRSSSPCADCRPTMREQRGVLDQQDELVGQRRDHDAEGLRQDDRDGGPGAGHARATGPPRSAPSGPPGCPRAASRPCTPRTRRSGRSGRRRSSPPGGMPPEGDRDAEAE